MVFLWVIWGAILLSIEPVRAEENEKRAAPFAYAAKDYSHLLHMNGWNASLLLMHFKLYQGYVTHTNLLMQKITLLAKEGQAQSYEFGALKRRLDWEFDGMRLHELYFGNLGGDGKVSLSPAFTQSLESYFGSIDGWRQNFSSTGMIRGIGWVVLYRDKETGVLFNVWVNEHDVGHLVEADPLLVMDVFEHAYITQFGLDKDKYIDLFLRSLDWAVVQKRFDNSIAPKREVP